MLADTAAVDGFIDADPAFGVNSDNSDGLFYPKYTFPEWVCHDGVKKDVSFTSGV